MHYHFCGVHSQQRGAVLGEVLQKESAGEGCRGLNGAHMPTRGSGEGEMPLPRLVLEGREEILCMRAAACPSFSAHVPQHLKEGSGRPDSQLSDTQIIDS